MRSNRRLVRKNRKVIQWAAHREANRQPVPIFAPMWINYEILRAGVAIRQAKTNAKRHQRNTED